jgi:hypothetical protein
MSMRAGDNSLTVALMCESAARTVVVEEERPRLPPGLPLKLCALDLDVCICSEDRLRLRGERERLLVLPLL